MESERLYRSQSGIRKYVSRDGSNPSTGSPLSSFTEMFKNPASNNEEEELTKNQAGIPHGTKKNDCISETDNNAEHSNIEDAATRAMRDLSLRSPLARARLSNERSVSEKFEELHHLMIRRILDMLFGRKSMTYEDEVSAETMGFSVNTVTEYEYTESYYHESESVSFDAQGIVKTEDGREININLNIGMSREFTSYYTELTGKSVNRFCDPLVINFDNAPASLSDMKFFFDLDCDGENNEISVLNPGSGFLALDKNSDGIINDGSELFGTSSGDGFKDLAAYDEDGNGWIDENDAVFNLLKIWVSDGDGNSHLYSLKDKNVGAIFLGAVDTEYSLNSSFDNSTNGLIRKTGLFLYETGEAGSVQHVDLVS